MLRHLFLSQWRVEVATGIYRAGFRDAAKHAIMCRIVPTTKRYLAKTVLMSRSKHLALHVSLQITATTAYPSMFPQVPTIILV